MELPIQITVVLTIILISSLVVIVISNDLLFRSQDIVLDKLDFTFDNQIIDLNSITPKGVVEISEKCIKVKKTSTKEELCVIIRLGIDSPNFNDIKNSWVSLGHDENYLLDDGCGSGGKNLAMYYIPPDIIKLKCN